MCLFYTHSPASLCASLLDCVSEKPPLKPQVQHFVALVKGLLIRLLDYRTVMSEDSRNNRMSCTVNLLVRFHTGPDQVPPSDLQAPVHEKVFQRSHLSGVRYQPEDVSKTAVMCFCSPFHFLFLSQSNFSCPFPRHISSVLNAVSIPRICNCRHGTLRFMCHAL